MKLFLYNQPALLLWTLRIALVTLGTIDSVTGQESDLASLKTKVESGDAAAMLELADVYVEGVKAELNLVEAKRLYTAAAEASNADGWAGLGEIYRNGLGVNVDHKKANSLFEKAVEQSSQRAQVQLAESLINGVGISVDIEKGLETLKPLAENEMYAPACLSLGKHYLGDMYANPDDQKLGLKWLRRASKYGSREANVVLGDYHAANFDSGEAKERYQLAADENDPWALLALSKLENNDEEATAFRERALKWLNAAAEQNHAPALATLGAARWTEHELARSSVSKKERASATEESLTEIRELVVRSANLGYADGQYLLANMLGNKKLAKGMLQKAAEQGHAEAQFQLAEKLLQQATDENKETEEKVLELLEQASLRGHADAAHQLKVLKGEMGERVIPEFAGSGSNSKDDSDEDDKEDRKSRDDCG